MKELFIFFVIIAVSMISSSSSQHQIHASSSSSICIPLTATQCNSSQYNTTCKFCTSYNTCIPNEYPCNQCYNLPEYICTAAHSNKSDPHPILHPQSCTWCPEQNVCTDNRFVEDGVACECSYFDPPTCLKTDRCKWCPTFGGNCFPNNSEGFGEFKCECWNFSGNPYESEWCEGGSGGLCSYCPNLNSLCVTDRNYWGNSCLCDILNETECRANDGVNCIWCDSLQTCTVAENKNCECYFFTSEEKCSNLGNSSCQWCAESVPDAGFNNSATTKNTATTYPMNYCMQPQDQCKCSFLPDHVCGSDLLSAGKTTPASSNCQKCDIYLSPTLNASYCVYTGGAFGPNGTSHGGFISTTSTSTSTSTTTTTTTTSTSTTTIIVTTATTNETSSSSSSSPLPETSSTTEISFANTTTTQAPYSPADANLMCSCFNFQNDQYTCEAAFPACSWNSPILTLPGAVPYCSTYQSCSPLSCQAIKDEQICRAAQCNWEGNFCTTGSCFFFFVSGFLSSPFILQSLGWLKDCCVLLFVIGVCGDFFGRILKRGLTKAKKTFRAEKLKHVKSDLDTTVYISDSTCRDDVDFSFHEYCDKIRDLLLEGMEKEDEKKKVTAHETVVLRDCVAYSLFNNGYWLPNILLATGKNKNEEDEQENNNNNNDDKSPLLMKKLSSIVSDNEKQQQQQHQDENGYGSATLVDDEPLINITSSIELKDFRSIVHLQEKVDNILLQHADSIIYYAQSRSTTVNMASAMNSFPSAVQCVYYVGSIILLFGTSLHVVTQDPTLSKVAAGCQADSEPTTMMTTSSPHSSPSSSSSSSTLVDDSALRVVVFFLTGYRLLNASTFSTFTLVLVKTVRGIFQKYRGLDELTLQQRLPLIALYSDRKIHIMLFVYFSLVLPFAFSSIYGFFFVSKVCGYPIAVGLGIMILDLICLWLFRRFVRGKTEEKNHQHQHRRNPAADSGSFSSAAELQNAPSVKNNDANDDETEVPQQDQQQQAAVANFFTVNDNDDDTDESDTLSQSLEKTVAEKQLTINSSAPLTLWKAFLVFLLTEEIPTICIALAFQTSFVYTSLLHFQDDFALRQDHSEVVMRDYQSRSVRCIIQFFEHDVSTKLADLSTFFPFM